MSDPVEEINWARMFALLGLTFAAIDALWWWLAFTIAPGAANPAVAFLLGVVVLEALAAITVLSRRKETRRLVDGLIRVAVTARREADAGVPARVVAHYVDVEVRHALVGHEGAGVDCTECSPAGRLEALR